jgi:hypothetical protein
MVPVFKTLILALALVSSIVVVFYFGVTASFSISAAHIQTASSNVADPRATFMFSTNGTKGSAAAQLPVPSRPRHMYARNPCMCCFRACSGRWTVPFFWKAYLSIEQPLTAHGPIHLKVSSRHDP